MALSKQQKVYLTTTLVSALIIVLWLFTLRFNLSKQLTVPQPLHNAWRSLDKPLPQQLLPSSQAAYSAPQSYNPHRSTLQLNPDEFKKVIRQLNIKASGTPSSTPVLVNP